MPDMTRMIEVLIQPPNQPDKAVHMANVADEASKEDAIEAAMQATGFSADRFIYAKRIKRKRLEAVWLLVAY